MTAAQPSTDASPWSALRADVFRRLWIATVVSNVGSWMFNAAAGWLMTSLNSSPLIVSLVQVANSLPLFLFALPAGALADLIDKRRLILILEILTTVFSAVFALLVSLHAVTPGVLLVFILLIGTLGALETPAWQAIVPLLVDKQQLPSAIAINSVGINISRVLGPALTGIVIVGLGIAAPFWLDAFSNIGVIAVLLWWRARTRNVRTLPAEHLWESMRSGLRYVRNSPQLRGTLTRAVGFFLFSSSYWALLPVLSRSQLHGGPTLYGVLLAAIGAGAVGGAFALPRARRRLGAGGVVDLGGVGTAAALFLFGAAHEPWVAVVACLLAGVSWIAVLASLNISAQLALPEWVRGRGLAVYVTVFFGTLTVGSALWGWIAESAGLPAAHYAAGAGALLAMALTRGAELLTGPEADLTPSMHWPEPVLAGGMDEDAGPVLVTVEYRITPESRTAFLVALEGLGRERRRDGAYAWNVFQDAAHPERILETFLVDSWLEHLRQHRRVTKADSELEDRLREMARADPLITHYIAIEKHSPAKRLPAAGRS